MVELGKADRILALQWNFCFEGEQMWERAEFHGSSAWSVWSTQQKQPAGLHRQWLGRCRRHEINFSCNSHTQWACDFQHVTLTEVHQFVFNRSWMVLSKLRCLWCNVLALHCVIHHRRWCGPTDTSCRRFCCENVVFEARVAGRLRHIKGRLLWLQSKVASHELRIKQVKTIFNVSDVNAKPLQKDRFLGLLFLLGFTSGGMEVGADEFARLQSKELMKSQIKVVSRVLTDETRMNETNWCERFGQASSESSFSVQLGQVDRRTSSLELYVCLWVLQCTCVHVSNFNCLVTCVDGFMDMPDETCTCNDVTFQLCQCCSWWTRNQRPSLEPRLEPNTWHVHFCWCDLLCSFQVQTVMKPDRLCKSQNLKQTHRQGRSSIEWNTTFSLLLVVSVLCN